MYSKIIIRHSAPSKLDHAPWGTSCKVFNKADESFDLYRQFSNQENNPHWELMGTFSDDALDAHVLERIKI